MLLDPLWKISADLTQRYPAGNEPFQIIARLLEESGELAQQVNHAQGSGIKHQKHGDPDMQKMAKEVMDVVRCALQVAQYYHIEPQVEALFQARLAAAQTAAQPTAQTTAQNGDRPRVSAAVLRHNATEILMVQHRHADGRTYWQLPGGGVIPPEPPESAVLRELQEETGLTGTVHQHLFTIPYRLGTSTTYLVSVAPQAVARLGHDPEEVNDAHQKLAAVAWRRLEQAADSPEVGILRILLPYLPFPLTP